MSESDRMSDKADNRFYHTRHPDHHGPGCGCIGYGMTDQPARISGWCQTLGRPDSFHQTCVERIAAGWITRCDCPGHLNDKED